MKKIWKYLQSYFKEEIKPAYFISIALLVAASIYAEYTYDLEKNYVNVYYGQHLKHILASIVMYGIPFIGTYLLYIFFYKRYDLLTNPKFWGLLLFALVAYSVRSGWYGYRDWVRDWSVPEAFYYNMRTSNQIAQASLLFFPLLLYWVFVHRKQMPLYGFKIKGVDLKPYAFMLLCMVPLVAWASFQRDFLNMYPVYKNIVPQGFSTQTGTLKILFFEACYGVDFVMTEFYFRGFLILAFAKFVGRGCVMPMVAFYVFIHFGKPLGETCSSFFGGLILGVIAYETKSIIGGIMAHLGVAWMMETGGTFGREFHLVD
jgi:hypothetical protein